MKILVVDDDNKICRLLSKVLKKEGYSVKTAGNGRDAIRFAAEENHAVVFLDIKMPGLDGIEVLKEIKKISPDTAVIMITGYGYMRFVVEAMKLGAYDYIPKPFKLNEIRAFLKKIKERCETEKGLTPLPSEIKGELPLDLMNGHSPSMLKIYKAIGEMASVKTAVLIRGESGTGKELVAKAIHFNSSRKDEPFIVVDCASLPPTLLESELLGHEKGSFTGAIGRKIGKFEAANNGTLFLDEIGNLHMDTQTKLLRALQEKEIVRVGGNKPVKVDVRIIAATNQDLEKAMQEGRFKADLYYRLNVVSIRIPPLRERKDDIPLLINQFLNMYKNSVSNQARLISKECLDVLLRYNWPGNVRELENVIERAVVTGKNKAIWPEDLPETVRDYSAQKEKDLNGVSTVFDLNAIRGGISFNRVKNKFEKDLIQAALKETGANLKETARTLNITLRSLRYMVKKYSLKAEVRSGKRAAK